VKSRKTSRSSRASHSASRSKLNCSRQIASSWDQELRELVIAVAW
jgi:hypothetical protein